MSARVSHGVAIALILCSFALPVSFMRRKSISYDETSQFPAGISYWATNEVEINRMHPPLVKLVCTAPLLATSVPSSVDAAEIHRLAVHSHGHWIFGKHFVESHPERDRLLFYARIPAVLLSTALAVVVWRWSAELWGPLGGLISLALYVFDPTLTSHAQFVKNDVGGALFMTLFVFVLRRVLAKSSSTGFALAGLCLGLALGAKYTNLVLLPIASAFVLLAERWRGLRHLAVLCSTAYATLWIVYLFPSDPLFYFRGLGEIGADAVERRLYVFLGELREGTSFAYLPVALLVKTPLPTLLLLAAAIGLILRTEALRRRVDRYLLVPPIVFIVAMGFVPPFGVRYGIPILPFAFVLTGAVGRALETSRKTARASVAALVCWLLVEFVAIAPDHLSYFNQIARGYRGGLWWLSGSDVDWGQGLIQLSDYLSASGTTDYRILPFTSVDPKIYGITGTRVPLESLLDKPGPGTLIISSHYLAGLRVLLGRHGNDPANWLGSLEPRDVVGHTFYVYDVR